MDIKFAVYKDNNCYICKPNPQSESVVLVEVVGFAKGPFGKNPIVKQSSEELAFALPKLHGLSDLELGFYAIKFSGIECRGKYTEFTIEKQAITKEQFHRMETIFPQESLISRGIFEISMLPKNIIVGEKSPAKASSEPAPEEFLTMKEVIAVCKKAGISFRYYSEDHYCLMDNFRRRVNETKNGFRKEDVQSVIDEVVERKKAVEVTQ